MKSPRGAKERPSLRLANAKNSGMSRLQKDGGRRRQNTGSSGNLDYEERMPSGLAAVLERIDAAFLRRQCIDSVEEKSLTETNIRRWVHGEADGLPGMVVESYAQVARLEFKEEHYLPWIKPIGEKLLALGMRGVVFVHRTGKKAEVRPLMGHCPRGIIAKENGNRFFVRLVEGDAVGTGIFVDLREGRCMAQMHARGRPFLNLFAHAGAYGVAALRGGASRIDHVDSGRKTASWAALNLALNGADPRGHRFIIDDAFDFLARAAKKGPQYGVVACDPPTTALRPKGKRFVVRDSLPVLAADSCRALLRGGHLILTCNDRSLSTYDVEIALREGAEMAQRKVVKWTPLSLPDDLPPGGDVPVRGGCATLL